MTVRTRCPALLLALLFCTTVISTAARHATPGSQTAAFRHLRDRSTKRRLAAAAQSPSVQPFSADATFVFASPSPDNVTSPRTNSSSASSDSSTAGNRTGHVANTIASDIVSTASDLSSTAINTQTVAAASNSSNPATNSSSANSTTQDSNAASSNATSSSNSTQNIGQEPAALAPPSPELPPPATSSLVVNYSAVQRPGSEISTSVLLYGFSDMEGEGWSFCERAVNDSLGYNSRKINYVLTVFAVWGNRSIYSYNFKDYSDVRGVFIEINKTSIARWEKGLRRCFKAGIDAGFTTLHVILHANFMSGLHGHSMWRNTVKFDPAAKVGPPGAPAYTYSEVLLQPAAAALNAVVNDKITVEMALGGEQGLSVFGFPKSYMAMLDEARVLIPNAASVTSGVSFNYDKVCGCVEPEERDPIIYNNTYPERFQTFKSKFGFQQIDLPGVKSLLDKSDFIGLSSYAPLPEDLTFQSMEVAIETVAFEFLYFGIDLKKLLFVDGKQLIYSEQGLGGLTDNGRIPTSLEYIRNHPYSGAGPAYSAALDPWKIPEYRSFRRELYGVLTAWAAAGGGPQYRIDGIFLWSMGTWDVHAAHPLSLGLHGSYGDPVIQEWIRQANARVNRDYLDEINSVKPLIPGPRKFIMPPWLIPSPKPSPPPAPANQTNTTALGSNVTSETNATSGTDITSGGNNSSNAAESPAPQEQQNGTTGGAGSTTAQAQDNTSDTTSSPEPVPAGQKQPPAPGAVASPAVTEHNATAEAAPSPAPEGQLGPATPEATASPAPQKQNGTLDTAAGQVAQTSPPAATTAASPAPQDK